MTVWVVIIGLAFAGSGDSRGDAVDQALAMLRGPAPSNAVCESARALLLDDVRVGDRERLRRLHRALEDDQFSLSARMMILEGALATVDEGLLGESLSMVQGWVDALAGQPADPARASKQAEAQQILLTHFVRSIGRPPWSLWAKSRPEFVRLLTVLALDCPLPAQIVADALGLLRRGVGNDALRAELAKELMQTRRRHQGLPRALVALQRTEAIPYLRQLVVESGEDPLAFEWRATWLLSDMGDQGIVPHLEALRAKFSAVDAKAERQVRYHLWRIAVQHPPEQLLEQIAKPFDRAQPVDRSWAIRRAAALGLPKEKIREAILAHAATIAPRDVRDTTTGKVHRFWPDLSTIKAVGMEVGALSADDLPHIPVSGRSPHP